jgi:hypothetical protein
VRLEGIRTFVRHSQNLLSAYMRFFNAMTDQNEDPAELRASVSPRLIIG